MSGRRAVVRKPLWGERLWGLRGLQGSRAMRLLGTGMTGVFDTT